MPDHAAFSTPYNAARRAFVLSATVFFVVAMGNTIAVSAQQAAKITVEAGKTKTNTVRHPVDARNVQITVAAPAIAKASYDAGTKRFVFEGVATGQTRVIIVGTYQKAVAGGTSNSGGGMTGGVQPGTGSGTRQQTVRYRHLVDVTVIPQRPDPNANAFPASVIRGQQTDVRIDAVLGPEFLRPADNGRRWRNLVFTFGDNRIARAELAGQTKVRITGVKAGSTRLRLEGERYINNAWEKVSRPIAVTVTEDPDANAADPWMDGQERRLQTFKDGLEQAGTSEYKLDQVILYLEPFVRSLEEQFEKEERSQNRRPRRIARLNILQDEAELDLVRARNRFNEAARQVRRIGWRAAWDDANPGISLRVMPARRTFVCGRNPDNKVSGAYVWGTERYLGRSHLCPAAVHAGVIGAGGGTFTVEFRAGSTRAGNYVGSSRNGVDSNAWTLRDWGSFVFVSER